MAPQNKPMGSTALAVVVCTLCLLPALTSAQLRVGFYDRTCPNAETLVRQAVATAFAKDAGAAAGLIRLHFHDCFVRGSKFEDDIDMYAKMLDAAYEPWLQKQQLQEGCDASVLLVTNPGGGKTEREAAPNNPSLRGFEVIDAAKAAVERSCPSTVSCADILAFAARDSITLTGNVFYPVPAGRRDGTISTEQAALDNLPPPTSTAQELTGNFSKKGLTVEEMVILSGAHTVGRSFCSSFADRIWNGNTPIVDAGLSPSYAALLRALCPTTTTPATTAMDPGTPNVLDNNYYKLLPRDMGLFFSDNQLRTNPAMNALVNSFAKNEMLWKERFTAAMVKMGRIEVQTGRCGQIRLNCNVVNPSSSSSMELVSGAPVVDEEAVVATS